MLALLLFIVGICDGHRCVDGEDSYAAATSGLVARASEVRSSDTLWWRTRSRLAPSFDRVRGVLLAIG